MSSLFLEAFTGLIDEPSFIVPIKKRAVRGPTILLFLPG